MTCYIQKSHHFWILYSFLVSLPFATVFFIKYSMHYFINSAIVHYNNSNYSIQRPLKVNYVSITNKGKSREVSVICCIILVILFRFFQQTICVREPNEPFRFSISPCTIIIIPQLKCYFWIRFEITVIVVYTRHIPNLGTLRCAIVMHFSLFAVCPVDLLP